MIALLRGRLRRRLEDRVIVECGGVGYEVFLPPVAMKGLGHADEVELSIHYHATRDQPRPILIGFVSDLDREFFEKLITVKDIGPLVAARALVAPVAELAAAIARQDERYLRQLPGIGPQKAKNIVAQLQAKVSKFALARDGEPATPEPARGGAGAPAGGDEGLRSLVWDVLVKQLGHRPGEASQLITDAFARRPDIATPEELFDEIYRGVKQ
ncbi:MAG: Holliday junction DNA helicase RuvA [Candidatus Rokubacteria bacterium]|nr:Holliday junction DNA helicase RuvA [Candidatus Rokubacteria bacterium]